MYAVHFLDLGVLFSFVFFFFFGTHNTYLAIDIDR